MRDHSKLKAFQLAECLRCSLRTPTNDRAVLIYRISKDFLKDEIYGLTSQIRRSAVSVFLNIRLKDCKDMREGSKQKVFQLTINELI
jgi:four helix bundle protein